jgi:hypothetical protein
LTSSTGSIKKEEHVPFVATSPSDGTEAGGVVVGDSSTYPSFQTMFHRHQRILKEEVYAFIVS